MSDSVELVNHPFLKKGFGSLSRLKTFRANQYEVAAQKIISASLFQIKSKWVYYELTAIDSQWRGLIQIFMTIFLSIVPAVLLTNSLLMEQSIKKMFQFVLFAGMIYSILSICILLLLRIFGYARFLAFDSKQITLVLKDETLRYNFTDLQVHILKVQTGITRYTLELEILDEDLPLTDRMILLEMSTNLANIEGKAAVLLSILRGEAQPLKDAKPPRFAKMESGAWWSWPFRLFFYLDGYISTYFSFYLPSKIIFWTVHGSAKKALKKYAAAQ